MDFYKVCVLDKEGNPQVIYEYNGENPQIHSDDTINTIKKKILYELASNGIDKSYDELYLFTKVPITEFPKQIFDSVYKLGETIDQPIFNQLCRNLGFLIEDKSRSKYTYQDLLKIVTRDSQKTINKSLGIQFSKTYDYSFPMNPYSLVDGFFYNGSSDNRLLSL